MIDAEQTQRSIGAALGWSESYVNKIINGKSSGKASVDNKQKILDFLEDKIKG